MEKKGYEAVEHAALIIKSWQAVTRDIIMTLLNQPELMRYAFLDQEIHQAAALIDINEARHLEERLRKAAIYLKANVSPNIVLENILINV
jgi:hypothetical protein